MNKRTMRLVLLISVSVVLMATAQAFALTFTFSDQDYVGGASWGTMTITTYDTNTLQVLYEASTSAVIPAGSQVTGFGFDFDPDQSPTVSNPADGDFSDDQESLDWIILTNLNAIPNPANGDEFIPNITKSDYTFGVTEGNANNFNPPGVLPGQKDYFYLTFGNAVPQDEAGLEAFVSLTGIRVQSLPGSINGGSLFLAGGAADTASPVPEPSTVLLLGAGLMGLFFYGRKRFQG